MTQLEIEKWQQIAHTYLSHEDRNVRDMAILLLSYLRKEVPSS